MQVVPVASSFAHRPAAAAQVAVLRRKVRGSDALVRLLAELSFGAREDDMPVPVSPIAGAR